jgi:gamma-glutamylcyclotransferase
MNSSKLTLAQPSFIVPARVLYFAYGSNMLTNRLCARTPSAIALESGFIQGYQILFDKVSSDGSGKGGIVPTNDSLSVVYGVVFSMDSAEVTCLDRLEGVGTGYSKSNVTVFTETASYQAFTYIAVARKASLIPYDWYMALVVRGAIEHSLPAYYVERLLAIDAKPDTDQIRRRANESIPRDI